MSISYNEQKKIFKLDTANTSYIMGVEDSFGYLLHYYYGRKLNGDGVAYLGGAGEPPWTPDRNNRDKVSFLDCAPFEYPTGGAGDFRDHCLEICTADGYNTTEIGYVGYRIIAGKPQLEGLPATFGKEEDCSSLIIELQDPHLGLKVELLYTAYEKIDAITRSVKVTNLGTKEDVIYLTRVLSACLDMPNKDYSLMTMHGSWARERHMQYRKIGHGTQGVSSKRGETSHQDHPFIAVTSPNISQTEGEVYGMHFVYSGNFMAQVEEDQFHKLRQIMGINDYNFRWKLEKEESFQSPEVVMVYSATGLGAMTRTFHELYRNHLIRSPYRNQKRPILLNTWEAVYFDFNTDKIIEIAKEASQLGIELLVMDDGWFGNRYDDNRALGDWFVNEEKLPGGLKRLTEEINRLGMKFGIWLEPEMVSPDSDLYRAHPDWAIAVPGREASLCRNQYVLDLTREEVKEYVWSRIEAILTSANIEYVKWDMNRQLSDLGSYGLDKDRQGELYHRYVLAVYDLQERMLTRFPHVLLENCSGGGARFDPGMLYYSPQIWCSDNTDAISRLQIQEGTALIYPLSTMGAHVSVVPNHTVGRVTPFATRGHVALAGTFGYELNVAALSPEDKESVKEQVKMYHTYNDLVREGDYYRIASYRENNEYDCWQVNKKDGSQIMVTYVQVLHQPNYHSRKLYLQGLEPDGYYQIQGTKEVYGGDVLMYGGLPMENLWGDFQSKLIILNKK